MDIDSDSDTSERWEDFFGSSTELAPSLLGIYDTLTSVLAANQNINNNNDNSNSNSNSSSSNNNNKSNGNSTTTSSSSCSRQSSHNDTLQTGSYTLHQQHFIGRSNSNSNSDSNDDDAARNDDVVDIAYDGVNGAKLTHYAKRSPEDTFKAHTVASSTPKSQFSSINRGTGSNRSLRDSRESLTTASISSSTSSLSLASGGSSNSNSRLRNNIRVLSPNVQRIITHADAEPVDAIDIDALQQQQQQQQHLKISSPSCSPVPHSRYIKKSSPAPSGGHKVKLSHIPLSKITGKLTQSGSELVQTFDVNTEYLNSLNFVQSEHTLKKTAPPTPAVVPIPGVDDDKTPTNNVASPFIFEGTLNKPHKLSLPKYESQESIKLIEMEQLAATTQLLNSATSKPTTPTINGAETTHIRSKEFIATKPLSPIETVEAINFDLITQHIEQLTLCEDFGEKQKSDSNSYTRQELIQAINKPLISKPLVRSSSAASAATVAGSPLLTYARSKSLANKANTLGGPMPNKLPTAEELAALEEEANKISAESLDRLTDIKFSPKENRKLGSGLMLPDIAKLKHRPLSSSSICSTSSSSSSGSDQLNSKLTTSYLASVESLAESENELGDHPHTGLSVFERACLEIVDSERNYVEDLGQVIRGYLHDWKERACLRHDELKILFSNIEEIYEFNSSLLKQLINSGMDPYKIAKCFIDLRERFDVYTTYCTSYPEAISLLTKLLQATHTNALLASTQKMLQHTLPLGSYLLKPVQRILKYHLLLDNLRKHCDVKEVLQAHEIMRQVARDIDQVKRNLEQQSRVKELSGILDGWLGPELTVLGALRQEGLLMEHNKPRLVFLFSTMLIITKQKEDGRLQFKSYIHQNKLMLNEHLPGEPTSFYVIPYDEPRNQIKLTAKNRDQKRVWAQEIKGVMLEIFDIPKRAKELVYQLGDEEDRTPDRSTWKWSLHSNSPTLVYLERRNHYRRSEMRNRSKFKRKTVTNSSSFDCFNEALEPAENENDNDNGGQKSSKTSLARNKSMDDNMLPALQKFAAAVRNRSSKRESTAVSNAESEAAVKADAEKREDCKCEKTLCECVLRKARGRGSVDGDANGTKSPVFSYKALKERSKSVPRLGFSTEEVEEDENAMLRDSKSNLAERKTKGRGLLDIKQYTHKSMPKRIATLKKQRMNKKETSKFYMDWTEFDSSTPMTVLKITESSEDLLAQQEQHEQKQECTEKPEMEVEPINVEQFCEPKTVQEQLEYEALSPAEKTKRDAQIILDLLKNNKEFERIYNKQQKRRDSNSSSPLSPTLSPMREELPPRPPSRSPPPLESEQEQLSDASKAAALEQKDKQQEEEEEPIYESLLRNVHVPYKFSPVLSRAKTSQYYKPREKKSQPPAPRPESDYVTLVYSPEGVLQKVGEDVVPRQYQVDGTQRDSSSSTSSSSSSTVKRESQNTVINVACLNSQGDLSQASSSDTNTANEPLYARPIPKNLMKRLLNNSSNDSSKTSLENVSNSESSLLPRALKSIDNIALAFGRSNRPPERRVSDVSEMCRKSILHRQGSEAVGERMAHVDYADPKTLFNVLTNSEVSLQRDSVFSLTSSNDSVCDQQRKRSTSELPINFEYEQDVEESLENRDSAIYSDDNEKRFETDLKRPSSPPPLPPSVRHHPQILPKPSVVSPPTHIIDLTKQFKSIAAGEEKIRSSVIICPPHLSQAASRSWVLQQIENFNK